MWTAAEYVRYVMHHLCYLRNIFPKHCFRKIKIGKSTI